MALGNSVKIDGVWKSIANAKINIDNSWRQIGKKYLYKNAIWNPIEIAYGNAVKARGPLNYWRLGELSGSIAYDEMGVLDGTYSNINTYGVSGPPEVNDGNLCPHFQSTYSTQMVVPYTSAYSVPVQNSLVFECWFKVDVLSSYHMIFQKWGPGSAFDDVFVCQVINSTNRINFILFCSNETSINVTTTKSISADTWYYLVIVYNNKTVTVYVNNTIWATGSNTSFSGTIKDYFVPLYFAQLQDYGPTRSMNGYIDEFAIYNYDWYTDLTNKDWYNFL